MFTVYLWDRLDSDHAEYVKRHVPGIEIGVLTHIDRGPVNSAGMPVMVDVGLGFAKSLGAAKKVEALAVRAADELVRVAKLSRPSKAFLVLPDALGDFEKTRKAGLAAAEAIPRTVEKYGVDFEVVLGVVAHGMVDEWVAELADRVREASGFRTVVAYPSHIMDVYVSGRYVHIQCSKKPDKCASLILSSNLSNAHMLGPPMRLVRSVAPIIGVRIASFDTSSYRRAPSIRLKQLNMGMVDPRNSRVASLWGAYWLLKSLGRENEAENLVSAYSNEHV